MLSARPPGPPPVPPRAATLGKKRRFALMIGVNHTALGRLERGEVNFKFDKLERIALALGVEVKSLLDY